MISFQPGIEAGLLRALPAVGGAAFQLGNLLAEVRVESLFAPNSAAHQSVGTVRVRHALSKPQSARVLLFRIVHRVQRRGADTLHIPEVKELVSRAAPQGFSRI